MLLSRAVIERIAAAVRAVEAMAPGGGGPEGKRRKPRPYQQAWYRVVSNEGDGAYTARLQQWDANLDAEGEDPEASGFVDIDDPDHPEYGLDQYAFHARGLCHYPADAVVPGWRLWFDDEWYVVLDGGWRPASPAEYKVLQVQGTDDNAREVWDYVRLHE